MDVFSPNHLEISALFEDISLEGFQSDQLEAYALEFCKRTGMSGNGVVIVRCGEYGSLTTRNVATAKQVWLWSYYEAGAAEVVDATSGGNTYLEGFLQSWKASGDIFEGSVYAHVAASFAVKKIGLPAWEMSGGEETWNGVGLMRRLDGYREKLGLFKRGWRTLLRRM